jgi:hypothetical protein
MVSAAFKRFKRSRAKDFERVRHLLGFKVGTHKRNRLVRAVGKRVGKRTILDSDTHAQHQDKLFKRFQKAWGGLTKSQARDRLRFVTILHAVCDVDTNSILHAVEEMEAQLRSALSREIAQIGILGVSEVEIVKMGLYGKKDADDEARKGQVLRELARKKDLTEAGTVFEFRELAGKDHLALIHFHGIVDLGPDAANREICLQDTLRQTWKGSWCVELKRLFTDLSIEKSLRNLAGYLTKGGNDTLRFTKQFGSESPESLELAMVKAGYAESGEYDDHLGLSSGQVSVLVHVYDALMRRNRARDGYLFLGGTVIRNRYQSRERYRIWKSAVGNIPEKSTIDRSVRRKRFISRY